LAPLHVCAQGDGNGNGTKDPKTEKKIEEFMAALQKVQSDGVAF
jgi:hypothetical protein